MKKTTWGLSALLVVIIILGVFLIWHFSSSPLKTSLNGDESTNLASINVIKHHRYPDLIVSSLLWPASSTVGDHVVFSAVVKNQGTGATPTGTIIGISFWIDGVNVSWSDTNTTTLAPGVSVTLTANNGPSGVNYWTATAGVHTILGNVDDVNRIKESNESNNTLTGSMNVASSTPPPPPPPIPLPTQNPLSNRIGFSIGNNMYSMNDTDLNNQLNDMVSLRIGWLRFDVQWNQVQAQDSATFNWAPTDRVIQAVLAHHLQPLPILAYSPSWAQPVGCTYGFLCGTNKSTEFGVFAKTAAARYGSQGVHTWEIWNEPNVQQFWEPQPDVVAYSTLLKSAYAGIKSQDPSAIVVSAGLAPAATMTGSINAMDFITQMYGQGDKTYFDALGIHPYTYPVLPSTPDTWSAWAQMASTTPNIRSIMNANGDSAKQIWMTEFGAPTGGSGATDHVNEAVQNQMMIDAINGIKGFPSDGPLFWYTYKDSGTSPSTNENFFGIIRFDGSLKPAYTTLKTALAP